MTVTLENTESLYVKSYGEVCKKAEAARILSIDAKTLNRWIEEGRIQDACGGRRVNVRSIARYVCEPKRIDEEIRIEKMKRKYGTEYAV